MAQHGSETRRRTQQICARFTPDEADIVRTQAERAGVSVACLIRAALFNQSLPRSKPTTLAPEGDIRQLIGKLGPLKSALEEAAKTGNPHVHLSLIDAACRDLADMRAALMEALGRTP